MKVRHDMLARLLLHTCAAQQSHKYGLTGSHATERKRHATYYRRTKACRSRDELQSQESVRQRRQLHTGRPVLTRWRPRHRRRMDERTNDGRDYSAEGLHRSSDCDGQKRPGKSSPASRIQGVHRAVCIAAQCSAVAGKLGREHVWRSSRRTRS